MNGNRDELLKPIHYFDIEKYICIMIIFMMILLIGLNIFRIYKEYITANHSETKFFYSSMENILNTKGTITLSIDEEYPMLEVIINGKVVDKFEDNKIITIDVTDKDVVQINGSIYNNDIIVKIIDTSSNINTYFYNKEGLVKQNITTLAIIKM